MSTTAKEPRTERDMTAGDAMSSPVATVPDSGTILDAWSVMNTCHVRHAVVVRGDHCVGVLDDRDLVEAWHLGPSALQATPIKRLLRDRTSCVLPNASLRQVAELMNHARVDAVPVVDTTGKLRGLVTAGDVVHAVSQHGLHASSERSISTANPA